VDSLAKEAEEAAGKGNMKDLYMLIRKLSGKFQQTEKPIKDKDGNPITTTEEQLSRWAEHLKQLQENKRSQYAYQEAFRKNPADRCR
jgi:hypothetical protein